MSSTSQNPMLASYSQLTVGLVAGTMGICLFDHEMRLQGHDQALRPEPIRKWLQQLNWHGAAHRAPAVVPSGRGQWLIAIPLEQTDGKLLGVFCLQQALAERPSQPAKHAHDIKVSLKPLLDCLHRELAATLPSQSRLQTLTERTAELEWLFKITGRLKNSVDDRHVIEELLDAATARLDSVLGVMCIPTKRLSVERLRDPSQSDLLLGAWAQSKQHLLNWVQRQNRPLVVNGAGREGRSVPRCKILAVPIMRESGVVVGVLAFYNLPSNPDYASRHVFLARHLGRQAATLAETQFDLMTGLYTRGGLQQAYGQLADGADSPERSIIYIDVDHMHIVNELHGFEVGNELIVRIADLLSPPLLSEGALAARISADRFVVILPALDATLAAGLAEQLRLAAGRVQIGPASEASSISISCGVAALVDMPQGLDRAIAAAELACKTAKNRGRDRVELYACEDKSMMRQHGDAVAIGQLRAALKSDRLILYAQRIVPLQSANLPGGYEILLRLRAEDGSLIMPGPLINSANRYQLLPTIDRWVTQRALEMLVPYRGMLGTRGIGISLNVSGQSIGDETFVAQLAQQIKAARLPADCITIEITEQAAVTNLARANELIRQLKSLGCHIALDDFGTGANSLTTLKNLQITRVKIDGSFVRDVATDRNSRSTVRAIVELAAGLSIDTVAEYVETEAIAAEVRKLGVDFAQGYAYGKPEPLEEVLAALGSEESQRLHRLFLES